MENMAGAYGQWCIPLAIAWLTIRDPPLQNISRLSSFSPSDQQAFLAFLLRYGFIDTLNTLVEAVVLATNVHLYRDVFYWQSRLSRITCPAGQALANAFTEEICERHASNRTEPSCQHEVSPTPYKPWDDLHCQVPSGTSPSVWVSHGHRIRRLRAHTRVYAPGNVDNVRSHTTGTHIAWAPAVTKSVGSGPFGRFPRTAST
jgi:hypothetical protein